MRTLYICYLSLDEPLVQTQVLPYLRQLAAAHIEVYLLTFEAQLKHQSMAELAQRQKILASQGIIWSYLAYHKRPSVPATIYDVMVGVMRIFRLARRHDIEVLHARAHIPMLMALIARRLRRCDVIFDIRGLIAEEYADAGVWKPNSLPFRAIKWIERTGLRHASQIVVLTERARGWLVESNAAIGGEISVIPCCVDRSRFSEKAEPEREHFELVYAGSVVGLYMLAEMARFFLQLKRQQPNATFRILTRTPRAQVSEVLHRAGISDRDFEVAAVDPLEVAHTLQRARLGISFRKPTFSQIAASPTKIAEYLAAGIPVVSNAATGDVDGLLQGERVGITVTSFDDASLESAVSQALALVNDEGIIARCQHAAEQYFDLVEVGGKRYRELYERIARQRPAQS